jgi:hypothetical protein
MTGGFARNLEGKQKMEMKPGYPPCPCAACQEVVGEKDGPRRPCEKSRARCLSNMRKEQKEIILQAIKISGCKIEWRDEPDDRMRYDYDRKDFGSIWSERNDLSEFWRVYRELQNSPAS